MMFKNPCDRLLSRKKRRGAIAPVFLLILPILLLACGFAINLAYLQMVSTEFQVANDSVARAGGRALSILQDVDLAMIEAKKMAQANRVAGTPLLQIDGQGNESGVEFEFGRSQTDSTGRYYFQSLTSESQTPSSLKIVSSRSLPLVFQAMNFFNPGITHVGVTRSSVATQIDRDIALVLDRSGSMLYFEDEDGLMATLDTLYNSYKEVPGPDVKKYYYRRRPKNGGSWSFLGYQLPADMLSPGVHGSYQYDTVYSDFQWTPGPPVQQRRISSTERSNGKTGIYNRSYTNNVIYEIENLRNSAHTLGSSYTSSKRSQLVSHRAAYCSDYQYKYKTNTSAPAFSRWYYLTLGVDAFLEVLEDTVQEERISLVTFSSTPTQDLSFTERSVEGPGEYDSIRNRLAGIIPYNGTGIGDALNLSRPELVGGTYARRFAAKTIVVLSDGENNPGKTEPDVAATSIMEAGNTDGNFIRIHAMTFTEGAIQAARDDMARTAKIGKGGYFHADDGSTLIQTFRKIANNLPTILTEDRKNPDAQ